jgi:DNA-binding NarL/FixJ family response regulator
MTRALLVGPENSYLRDLLANPDPARDLEICHHLTLYPPPEELEQAMEQFTRDMILITLVDYNRALRVMSHVAAVKPHLPIIGLHTYCDQQLLLELMQAGVRELWFPPLDEERIRKSLTRLGEWRSAAGSDADKHWGG